MNAQLSSCRLRQIGGDLKTLTVVSGKGGTGKTSIVGSFAALAKNAVLADCDVDAANLSLLWMVRSRRHESLKHPKGPY